MALVTLRVLDGADRGRMFENLPTPISIGREEGNVIQLNDERISRCHLKIQDDEDKVVLTDLESTNGTKVNGETVQFWNLRPGDLIAVGRTLLLFGSQEQIISRLQQLRAMDLAEGVTLEADILDAEGGPVDFGPEMAPGEEGDVQSTLHTLLPPELPRSLSLGQAAQLAELLQYIHLRMRGLIQSVKATSYAERVTLEQVQWQNLLDLEDRLARYVRQISEPADD